VKIRMSQWRRLVAAWLRNRLLSMRSPSEGKEQKACQNLISTKDFQDASIV
jgi:hypothetical protein